LLAFLFGPLFIFPQIIINDNDMPQEDDTIRLSATIDFGTLNYEETGNNYLWDFSGLIPLSQSVDTFVSVQQTPPVYQLVFFLFSNLAQPMQNFDQIPGFQVTDAYEFFKNSNNDYRSVGYGVKLNGIPIPNKYDDPDIIYKFPLAYGNIDSSLSTHEFDIPGLGYLGGWKKRVNHADGWGTLMTPYGSFETIRVKSDVIQFDSIYIDSLGFGIPILRNYVEYKWLGDGFGLPLCTVTDDGILPTISYIDSLRTLFTGTVELSVDKPEILIYPNPVRNEINIEVDLTKAIDVEITLKTLIGQTIEKLYEGTGQNGEFKEKYSIGRLNLETGIYLLSVEIDNNLFTEKIFIHSL